MPQRPPPLPETDKMRGGRAQGSLPCQAFKAGTQPFKRTGGKPIALSSKCAQIILSKQFIVGRHHGQRGFIAGNGTDLGWNLPS